MSKIEIDLPAGLAAFVEGQVSAGLYDTPSDVIEDAVRRLHQEIWPSTQMLRDALAPGLADIAAGRTYELTLEEILAEARARSRAAE